MLEVSKLKISFHKRNRRIQAVRGISFSIEKGERVALVGESGCGKSVTALSLMKLIAPNGTIEKGEIRFEEKDILKLPPKELRHLRGSRISMIFQEPFNSLNPLFTIGDQLEEVLTLHRKMSKTEARDAAAKLMAEVGIPSPVRRLDDYPHQLSGGMLQRVMIAMAIGGKLRLLIADEPTTALDVTVQAQILELIKKTNRERKVAVLLITHDLGVVAEVASRMIVMYAGRIVEINSTVAAFNNPLHPYTRGLIDSTPALCSGLSRMKAIEGSLPDPGGDFCGCSFAPRCFQADPRCYEEDPVLENIKEGQVACFKPLV